MYQLKLPESIKIHNVFHVSLLKPYNEGARGDLEPPPIIIDGKEKFKVEEVLDNRLHYKKLQYLVKWLSYSALDNQWLSAVELDSTLELVDLFHKLYLNKPGQKTSVKRHT